MDILDYPKEYSNHAKTIAQAFSRGYYFDFISLKLVTPHGTRVTPKLYGKQRYPTVTIKDAVDKKKALSFAIHKFVGYQLFGEIALRKGVNVRHLDDNPLNLSKDNIAIGSSRDNNLDKPKYLRVRMAKHARSVQGKRPVTSKMTDQDAEEILKMYLEIKGNLEKAPPGTVPMILIKYPYSRTAVQAVCNGRSFPDIYERVIKDRNDYSKS